MKKKVICIAAIGIVLFCVLSAFYMETLWKMYPETVLTQETLYGEENQNLKDFEVSEEGRLTSLTGDPWIEYELNRTTGVKVIELDFSGVTDGSYWGEIFNMETGASHSYDLKNGKVLVWYETAENLKELRFDLVSSQSVSLNVNRVVINAHYELMCHALKQIAFLLLFISMFIGYSLLYIKCVKRGSFSKRNRIAAWGTGLAAAFLCGTFYYNLCLYKIVGNLKIWMELLTICFIACALMEIIQENRTLVVRGVEMILYAFIQVGMLEVLSGIEFNFKSATDGICNILIIMLVMLVVYVFSRNDKAAMLLVNVFTVVLGIANHFFYQFRGNPLELSDVFMAKTALTVIENYNLKIDHTIFFCIVVEIGLICLLNVKRRNRKDSRRWQQAAVVGAFGIFVILAEYTPDVGYWNITADTQNVGYLNAFVAYARRDMKLDKPIGYTTKKVEEMLAAYKKSGTSRAEQVTPNIIVLMNESFADLPTVYDFDTNIDGMPYIHSLTKNTVKGSMLVSVFGGSTANTEYEFLTGNTLAFLNTGSVPYIQYVKREQESLATELKYMGYRTIAFHPYSPGNYNRDTVYPYLGFDEFISCDNELPYCDSLRGYVTDSADVKDVLDIYETQKENAPLFIFNVTMQNHGGYNRNQSELEVTVKPKDKDLQYVQLLEYLSLVKKSDEAFEELTDYFKKQPEKTIILMFGDHQPGLDQEIYQTFGAEDLESVYTVPFVIWANYDIDEEENIYTSPNYLRAILLQKAGVTLGSYDSFLLKCRESYPAMNAMGYCDSEGNYHIMDKTKETEGMLYKYHVLQYGNMFDKSVEQELY